MYVPSFGEVLSPPLLTGHCRHKRVTRTSNYVAYHHAPAVALTFVSRDREHLLTRGQIPLSVSAFPGMGRWFDGHSGGVHPVSSEPGS